MYGSKYRGTSVISTASKKDVTIKGKSRIYRLTEPRVSKSSKLRKRNKIKLSFDLSALVFRKVFKFNWCPNSNENSSWHLKLLWPHHKKKVVTYSKKRRLSRYFTMIVELVLNSSEKHCGLTLTIYFDFVFCKGSDHSYIT